MGAVSVTGRDGETIESVEEMAGWFSSELMTSMPGWKQQIMVKLNTSNVHEVLDGCHAAHHISLALAAFGLTDAQRMPLYRNHRTLLRNGQWRQVVEELTDLSMTDPENEKMKTEIA